MSNLKIGGQNVDKIYLGTNEVDKVYLGDSIIHVGYCYPCLSATDKAPLTVNDIPNMELTLDTLMGNMYLSKYTEDVEFTFIFYGNTYGPAKLKLNEEVNPGVYGLATLRGDRIELLGMCNMRWVLENSNSESNPVFEWKINGIVYKYPIQ